MRLLLLVAALVVAPISYSVILAWYAPPIIEFGKFFIGTIAEAELWALLVVSPIIVATKLYEWLKQRGVI